jgi:hypothetical protein
MLGVVGAGLPQDVHATGIDYAPGQLTLRVPALPESARGALADALTAQGYRLQSDGDRLVVRVGGAP